MCKPRGTGGGGGGGGVHRAPTSKATGELGILAESNNEHELLVLHGMVIGVHVSCLIRAQLTTSFRLT